MLCIVILPPLKNLPPLVGEVPPLENPAPVVQQQAVAVNEEEKTEEPPAVEEGEVVVGEPPLEEEEREEEAYAEEAEEEELPEIGPPEPLPEDNVQLPEMPPRMPIPIVPLLPPTVRSNDNMRPSSRKRTRDVDNSVSTYSCYRCCGEVKNPTLELIECVRRGCHKLVVSPKCWSLCSEHYIAEPRNNDVNYNIQYNLRYVLCMCVRTQGKR